MFSWYFITIFLPYNFRKKKKFFYPTKKKSTEIQTGTRSNSFIIATAEKICFSFNLQSLH